MTQGVRKLHSIALNLGPANYLRGFRAEVGSLFLPTLSEGRVGDEVAARIGILGQDVRATLFGTIALVRRVGRPSLLPGVEVALDRMSVPAARLLAAAAKGEKVPFRERAPRYVVAMPLRISREGAEREAATINVSEGGCALSWVGPLPLVGEVLTLRLGEGLFSRKRARAIVCWNAAGGALQRCAGLRVLAEGRTARAWKAIALEAARSGARTN